MKKMKNWLLQLVVALAFMGSASSLHAQTPYSCVNTFTFSSFNNNTKTLNFTNNDYFFSYYYYSGSNYWNDDYYYQITPSSVSSVNTANLGDWTAFNPALHTTYVAPYTPLSINTGNLCDENYKIWFFNNACGTPSSSLTSFTFSTGGPNTMGLTIQDLANGKINIHWNPSYNAQNIPLQYCVYEASETPTTWTSVTSFYPNKITNINKDQAGNPFTVGTSYKVAIKDINTYCQTISTTDFTISSNCNPPVNNIVVTDLENGKVNISWDASPVTPADGYAWALVNQNDNSPSYPEDFRFVSTNSLTNIDTTYNGDLLEQFQDYYVVVIAACDTLTSYSLPSNSDQFTVTTCPNAPTNLVLTQTSNDTISISWTGVNPAPADGYKYIVFDVNNSSSFDITDFTDVTATTVTGIYEDFAGNPLNHQGEYEVRVLSSCGTNSFSMPISNTILIDNCANAPTQVSLTNFSDSLKLSFTAPSILPTDGYLYAISKIGDQPILPDDYTAIANTANTFVTIGNDYNGLPLQNNEEYVAHLVSVCNYNNGIASIIINDTTTYSTCTTAPTNIAITQLDGVLTVTFDGPTPAPADGYLYAVKHVSETFNVNDYIQVTGSPISNISTDAYGDEFVHNNFYKVSILTACNLNENKVSVASVDSILINNCAAPPTNLVATSITDITNISWTAPAVAPEDGYAIYIGDNTNAIQNYPSDFIFLDTNGFQMNSNGFSTDTYFVTVVSVCGYGHSTAISEILNFTSCSANYPTNIQVQTDINGVSANWNYSSSTQPANGYRYAIIKQSNYYSYNYDYNDYYYNLLSNPFSNLFTPTQSQSIQNITHDLIGNPMEDDVNYQIFIYGICDSINEFHSDYLSHNFTFVKCSEPSNVIAWINADNTISASWESNNTTVEHFAYTIFNNDSGPYPNANLNYSTTTTTGFTHISTTFDGQQVEPWTEYYINIYTVCDAANNIKSFSNGTYTDVENCDIYTNSMSINKDYIEDELTISLYKYNNTPINPSQGFQYAIVPITFNTNYLSNNHFRTFVSSSTSSTNLVMEGIINNTLNNESLIPNKEYRIIVRAVCDSTEDRYSYYLMTSFYAINEVQECNTVHDLELIDNNNKSINIKWYFDGISTNGFEYAVLPINTPVTASHYLPTASSPVYNVFKTSTGDSLVHGQAYAVYVRTKCGTNNYSYVQSQSITLHSTLATTDLTNEASVKVYPNPVSNLLTIELPSATTENATVTITDLTGKIITTSTLESAVSKVNVEDLVNGVYLITIDSKSVQKTIRVVKQ